MKSYQWCRKIMDDTSLTLDARALLLFLGTRPAGWRYSVSKCLHHTGWGAQKFKREMAKLKEAGQVDATYKHDHAGRITHTVISVLDSPSPEVRERYLRRRERRRAASKTSG